MYIDASGKEWSKKPKEIGKTVRIEFGWLDTFEDSLVYKPMYGRIVKVDRVWDTLSPVYDIDIYENRKVIRRLYRVREKNIQGTNKKL